MSVIETKKKESVDEDEIEIRLSDIILFLRNNIWTIGVGAIVGLIIGTLYAFNKPNLYTTRVTVMPELQPKGGSLGGLSSLAGLAGIDISNASGLSLDAIRPDVYPDVLQSVPFALYILQKPVYSKLLEKETSLQYFFRESDNKLLLGKLFQFSEDSSTVLDPKNYSKTLQITKEQDILVNRIREAITASYDKKSGIITVSAILPDPIVSATVARFSLEYLTNYMINYRTEKTRNQVIFLTRQVTDAKGRYEAAEYALSVYKDRNQNQYLNTAKIEGQRLQADFLLTQSVFNELSKQLTQAKIKVAEEAPVFKVLEPARVPLKKSGPQRSLILIGFIITGSFIGLMTSISQKFIINRLD